MKLPVSRPEKPHPLLPQCRRPVFCARAGLHRLPAGGTLLSEGLRLPDRHISRAALVSSVVYGIVRLILLMAPQGTRAPQMQPFVLVSMAVVLAIFTLIAGVQRLSHPQPGPGQGTTADGYPHDPSGGTGVPPTQGGSGPALILRPTLPHSTPGRCLRW